MDHAPHLRLHPVTDITVIGGRLLPDDAPTDDLEALDDADCEVLDFAAVARRRRRASPPRPPQPPRAA